MTERVLNLVYRALRDVNAQLPHERQIPLSPASALVGPGSVLDSLGLITLLVGIEEAVRAEFGCEVPLLDDNSSFEPDGPVGSVQALAAHVAERLQHEV